MPKRVVISRRTRRNYQSEPNRVSSAKYSGYWDTDTTDRDTTNEHWDSLVKDFQSRPGEFRLMRGGDCFRYVTTNDTLVEYNRFHPTH